MEVFLAKQNKTISRQAMFKTFKTNFHAWDDIFAWNTKDDCTLVVEGLKAKPRKKTDKSRDLNTLFFIARAMKKSVSF